MKADNQNNCEKVFLYKKNFIDFKTVVDGAIGQY